MDCLPNPHTIMAAFLNAHPILQKTKFSVAFLVGTDPKNTWFINPPESLQTAHERLSWQALMQRLHTVGLELAHIGERWGAPMFGASLAYGPKGYIGDIAWLPADATARHWTPRKFPMAQFAPLHARIHTITNTPVGTKTWATTGFHWLNQRVRAHTALEATALATALFDGTPDRPHTNVLAWEVVRDDPSPLTLWLPPVHRTEHDALDMAHQAQRAAQQSVKRWNFDGAEAFDTPVLVAEGVLEDSSDTRPRLYPTLDGVRARWDTETTDSGFDHQWAGEALVYWREFLAQVAGLPGLIGAPLALKAHITAIPGGDTLMGLKFRQHGKDRFLSPIEESDWTGFLDGWGARITGLQQLPTPTGLWAVGPTTTNARIVSAACADSAILAHALLWGERQTTTSGRPQVQTKKVYRLPGLGELGLQHLRPPARMYGPLDHLCA